MSITGDVASAGAIVGAFAQWLPSWAALIAVIWYTIQIWESDTVQTWIKGDAAVRRRRRKRQLAQALKLRHKIAAKAMVVHQAATALALQADQAAQAVVVEKEPPVFRPPQGNPPFGNE